MNKRTATSHGPLATGITGVHDIFCGGLPANLSYLTDTVLALHFVEGKDAVHKAICALKKRTGKHEATIRELKFDRSGISVRPPPDEFHGVLTGKPIAAETVEQVAKPRNAARR